MKFYNLNLKRVTLSLLMQKSIKNALSQNEIIKKKRYKHLVNATIFKTLTFKNDNFFFKIFKDENVRLIKKSMQISKIVIRCECTCVDNFLIERIKRKFVIKANIKYEYKYFAIIYILFQITSNRILNNVCYKYIKNIVFYFDLFVNN